MIWALVGAGAQVELLEYGARPVKFLLFFCTRINFIIYIYIKFWLKFHLFMWDGCVGVSLDRLWLGQKRIFFILRKKKCWIVRLQAIFVCAKTFFLSSTLTWTLTLCVRNAESCFIFTTLLAKSQQIITVSAACWIMCFENAN